MVPLSCQTAIAAHGSLGHPCLPQWMDTPSPRTAFGKAGLFADASHRPPLVHCGIARPLARSAPSPPEPTAFVVPPPRRLLPRMQARTARNARPLPPHSVAF
eukprot:EG_transcript_42572